MQALSKKDADGDGIVNEGVNTQDLSEKIREFDAKLKLDRDKFEYQKQQDKRELDAKIKIANKKSNTK
jgi:hypothetical protein